MSDDGKTKNLFFCIGIVCFIPVFLGSTWIISEWRDNQKTKRINASNTRTIGTIYKVSVYLRSGSKTNSHPNSYKILAEYVVNGKRYINKKKTKDFVPLAGAHFEIMYDQEHPEDSRIDFAKPVFLKREITDTITGAFLYTDAEVGTFSFMVNGQEYTGSQILLPGWKTTEYVDSCTVEYLVRDPRISIMKL